MLFFRTLKGLVPDTFASLFVFETGQLTNPRYVVNFPTKRHWRGKSRMADIESGLQALAEEIRQRGIRSIAIPPLGSGLGGLDWSDVRPRIEQAMAQLDDVQVMVFEPNGRPVLNRIEGHMVSGYADGGDRPDKELSLVPGAITDATAFLAHHPDTRARFDRVADLVEGFETPFGLELLSTVHWVVTHEGAQSVEAVVSGTYAWNERKRRFSPHQTQLALEVLAAKGWVPNMATVGS